MAVHPVQTSAAPSVARDATALRKVFAAIDAESCPQSFNFHMHTVFSDGQLQPEALMAQAIALGLQGLAITDHHTVQGYQMAQRWLDQRRELYPNEATPVFWTGTEINANLLDIEVHILGYAFDPHHPGLTPYLLGHASTDQDYQAENVIAALHAAGGLAVLAHPARYRRSPLDLIPAIAALGIDGVETYYAYSNPTPWQPSPQQTVEVKGLSESHCLLNTCGTDTHGMSLLQRL